jgi:AcrR family transcriptional regulator
VTKTALAPDKRSIKSEVVAYKRQLILEQASRLFFEMGYETSTLDTLAERLNVTKPFIYSYFKNKSEILSDICETGIQQSLKVIDEVLAEDAEPADQFKAIVAGVAAVVIRYQNYVVVYQREMKSLARADAQRILGLRHHFDVQVARLLEKGRAAGQFEIEDVGMTSLWVGGLLSWIPNWYMPNGRRTEAEVVQSLVETSARVVGLKPAHLSTIQL